MELVRYIHLNPVRAGVIHTHSELGAYPWTGHSAIIGKIRRGWQAQAEVLGRFGTNRRRAIEGYQQFIQDGWGMGERKDLSGGGLRRSIGGDWATLLEMKKNKEYIRGDERILGDGQFVADALKCAEEALRKKDRLRRRGWNMEKLAEKVCSIAKIEKTGLRKRGRRNRISIAKGLLAYWGNHELGLSAADIGRYLGMSGTAAGKAIEAGQKYAAGKGLQSLEDA